MLTLDKSIEESKNEIEDFKVVGKGEMSKLLWAISSEKEGWGKSARATEIKGVGCLVQVTTRQYDNIAEALIFVPAVKIVEDGPKGHKLVSMTSHSE